MLHWLHSLLPHIPHYGYVLVFIVVFLNNLGVPLSGETIFLGAGFILGRVAGSLWQPMAAGTAACFLGGICSFWLGRRLGHTGLERVHWLHLTPKRLKWPERFFKRHGAKANGTELTCNLAQLSILGGVLEKVREHRAQIS
jgi:membrane protein DedA with SNARE-associated domain